MNAPADGSRLRILIVAGARPNFMKIAPVLRAIDAAGDEGILVHTGQHYDAEMSDAFFRDLGIRQPDFHLNAGSASHAVQTARVMEAFEPVLIETRPDWVVVPGDVNSTLACALVAAKLQPVLRCRVAHLEAGLRSHDWRMPEEINRVITDRLSDLLLTPSADAHAHLEAEGIDARRIEFVGNVMIDTLFDRLPVAREMNVAQRFGLVAGGYVLSTFHRPSNVDDAESLVPLLEGLNAIAATMPVVVPLHPRTRGQVESLGLSGLIEGLRVLPPLGYSEMLSLTDAAAVVMTDSGGLQEETTALGIPCVTLREQTERPVTISQGTNMLTGWPLSAAAMMHSFQAAQSRGRAAPGAATPPGWDGHAAERVLAALRSRSV